LSGWGCPLAWLGDGECDKSCYNPECLFDNGDCDKNEKCDKSCKEEMISNGVCEEKCNNEACGWDGFDCLPRCSERCLEE
jgi:phage major head subunit gpT-like protein